MYDAKFWLEIALIFGLPGVLSLGFYLGWTWGQMKGSDEMVRELRQKVTVLR